MNIPRLKRGNIRVIFLSFQNRVCCRKYLKDNKHNCLHLARKFINKSLHLAWKHARIFVRRRYLLREGNCELWGTDNVFIILQIFFATRAVLKIGEYSRIFPSLSWGIFGYVTCLDLAGMSENIWWIISLDICPCTSSVPQCSQFSSSYALRKLLASRNW